MLECQFFFEFISQHYLNRYSEFNVLNFKAWNPDPSKNICVCMCRGWGWGGGCRGSSHFICITTNQI